jgi:hypothetical protein
MKWSSPVVFVVGAVLICVALAVALSSMKIADGGIAQAAGFFVAIWLMVWGGSLRNR